MKNKEKILDEISKHKCWILASIVVRNLASQMDKATVYRNLKKLSEDWKIVEEFSESGEKILKAWNGHHHHFTCEVCDKKINIWCLIKNEVEKIANEKGFTATSHNFSVRGICKDCKS